MSAEPSSVECPECGESFDPSKAGGWCTNPDCGEFRWEGDDEADDADVTCANCGKTVPDETYCKECGHELGTEPDDESDEEESDAEPGDVDVETEDESSDDESSDDEADDGDTGDDESPEDEPEPLTTCPSCGEDVQPEWSACPFCEENLDSHRSTEDDESAEESPEKVVVEVGDVDIEADDGDTVGRKVRSAHVRDGGDEDEAQYIHREHVRFEIDDDGAHLVNEGRNGTQLNGEDLDLEERVSVEEGDEVTFADVATGTIRVE